MNAELSEYVALVAEVVAVGFGNENTELPEEEPNGTCGEVAVPNIEPTKKTKQKGLGLVSRIRY